MAPWWARRLFRPAKHTACVRFAPPFPAEKVAELRQSAGLKGRNLCPLDHLSVSRETKAGPLRTSHREQLIASPKKRMEIIMSRVLASLAIAATGASAAPSFGTNDITPHGVFDQR